MKTLFLSVFVSTLLIGCIALIAQTNPNSTVLEQITSGVQEGTGYTNLNQVIVDMLKGVSIASGEIYQASKDAIAKAVDFTMQETPLVVHEFLTWRYVKALLNLLTWVFVAGIFFYLSYRLSLYMPSTNTNLVNDNDITEHNLVCMFKWCFFVIGLIIVLITCSVNLTTCLKIKTAPRIYLIEYVVDQFNANQK